MSETVIRAIGFGLLVLIAAYVIFWPMMRAHLLRQLPENERRAMLVMLGRSSNTPAPEPKRK